MSRANIAVNFREDDGRVVIGTDSFVSHGRGNEPWRSTFYISMEKAEAIVLRNMLNIVIAEPQCNSSLSIKG